MAENLYRILGLKDFADLDQVKAAYRQLALKVHPDRSPDPAATDRFIEVNKAYEVLSDPKRKRDYDAALKLRAQIDEKKTEPIRGAKVGPISEDFFQAPSPSPSAAQTQKAKSALVLSESNRMIVKFSRGELEEAERLANKVLGLDSRHALAYAVLGDVAAARGNLKLAAKQFAYACQMDPSNPLYLKRHVEMLDRSQRLADGKQDMNSRKSQGMGAFGICALLPVIVIFSWRNPPLLNGMGPFSGLGASLVLSSLVSGFFGGMAGGLNLMFPRFSQTMVTLTGNVSLMLAFVPVFVINFWLGALLLIGWGIVRNALGSTSLRVIGLCLALLVLHTLLGTLVGGNPTQILLWLGSLIYIGALLGWAVADVVPG